MISIQLEIVLKVKWRTNCVNWQYKEPTMTSTLLMLIIFLLAKMTHLPQDGNVGCLKSTNCKITIHAETGADPPDFVTGAEDLAGIYRVQNLATRTCPA